MDDINNIELVIQIVMYVSLSIAYAMTMIKTSQHIIKKQVNIKREKVLTFIIYMGLFYLIIPPQRNTIIQLILFGALLVVGTSKKYIYKLENFYIAISMSFYIIIIRDLIVGIISAIIQVDTFMGMSVSNLLSIVSIASVIFGVNACSVLILKYTDGFNYLRIDLMTAYLAKGALIFYTVLTRQQGYEEQINIMRMIDLFKVLLIDYMVLRYLIAVGRYKDKAMEIDILENIMSKQKEHHRKEIRKMEHVRKFRHDYKGMVTGLNYLINTQQTHKLKQFLEDMDQQMMLHTEGSVPKYSNHLMIEEILCAQEERMKNKGIVFNANINLPQNITLSEVEICRIFSNVLNNSIEACEKVTQDNPRYITIKSYQKNIGTLVNITNSFDGNIKYNSKGIQTTKIDANEHGFGINNIRYILNNKKGNLKINVDVEKKQFELILFLPQENT